MSGDSFLSALKIVGSRFLVVSIFPSAVLAVFVLGLISSGAPSHAPSLRILVGHAEHVKGWTLAMLALGILTAALVVEPLQLGLVRVFEGYWGEGVSGRLLAWPAITYRRWRARSLTKTQMETPRSKPRNPRVLERAARRLSAYPPETAVLPTRIGNILRASELRAGGRYGLDAITTWPLLYPLLSDQVRAVADGARDDLDLSLRFVAIFLAAAVVSAGCLVREGWWLAVSAGCLLLAWVAHRGSLAAAAAYGRAVEVAFDLHRFDLLVALHLPLPNDWAEEVRANRQLKGFLAQPMENLFLLDKGDLTRNIRYVHGVGRSSSSSGRPSLWAQLAEWLVARGVDH
jgi:hypothetical protein